jgi:hypothetical protein
VCAGDSLVESSCFFDRLGPSVSSGVIALYFMHVIRKQILTTFCLIQSYPMKFTMNYTVLADIMHPECLLLSVCSFSVKHVTTVYFAHLLLFLANQQPSVSRYQSLLGHSVKHPDRSLPPFGAVRPACHYPQACTVFCVSNTRFDVSSPTRCLLSFV